MSTGSLISYWIFIKCSRDLVYSTGLHKVPTGSLLSEFLLLLQDFEPLHASSTYITELHAEQLLQQRQARLEELKNCCRFCFTTENPVPTSKLEEYSINSDFLRQLDLMPQFGDIFSELLCESCFQQIIEIDAFRKRVKEAQNDVINEIQEFDDKLNEIRNSTSFEVIPIDSTVEVYEEHLTEEEIIEEDFIEEIVEDEQMLDNDVDLKDDHEIVYETEFEIIDEKNSTEIERSNVEKSRDENKSVEQGVDEYEMFSTDDIIKNPERNQFCFKIYECFFCKMVC